MLPIEKRILTEKQLKETLSLELKKYSCKSYYTSYLLALLGVREQAILVSHAVLLRKAEYYTNTNKKIRALFYKFFLRHLQNKYCLHIPLNCCAKGFKIMHVGPVLINEKSFVDENCSFHINTALVAGGTTHAAPTLGKGVVVGIGAVVLGNTHISDNVAIGANAVVNKDVLETNIAVAGVPAKKISNNGRLTWNVKNKNENSFVSN